MKRALFLLFVAAVLVSIAGCDTLESVLQNARDTILEEWNPEDYGLVTLYVEREGQQASGTSPIYWLVSGWATVPIGFDHTSGEGFGLVAGSGSGMASWTFSGGGCSGSGTWPVEFVVSGFFDGQPKCSIALSVEERWQGGQTSTMDCAAVGSSSTINDSLGYSFGAMEFNVSNMFTYTDNTAGTPSAGAAGDDFSQWSWSDMWQITQISVPGWFGCEFDFGR